VATELSRTSPENRTAAVELDETSFLSSAAEFMTSELGFPIQVLSGDADGLYDPQGKSRAAVPGRPAIYLE